MGNAVRCALFGSRDHCSAARRSLMFDVKLRDAPFFGGHNGREPPMMTGSVLDILIYVFDRYMLDEAPEVPERETLAAFAQGDRGQADVAAQLFRRHYQRTGAGADAGRGLRERGRARGMEHHVALDLLLDLVDVAVEAGPRAEAAEGLESENARLKKLLADAMLDNAALKDLLAKQW